MEENPPNPPSFPRPSSAIAKSRLKNRLQCVGPQKAGTSSDRNKSVNLADEKRGIGETQFDDDDSVFSAPRPRESYLSMTSASSVTVAI